MVSDLRAGLLSSFQAGSGDWQLGTLTVGNIDGSPDLEIVVPYRDNNGQWFLDAFKWNGTRLPGFPWSDGANGVINVSPTLYDLNGDGTNEIIITCGAKVVALNGKGQVLWSSPVTYQNYIPTGGFQVVTNGFYWYPTGAWLPTLPSTAIFYSEVSPPIVADVEGKGVKEVITAWKIDPDSTGSGQDYNPFISPIWGSGEWGTMGENWSGGVMFHNATNGAQRYTYHIHQLVESGVALGHADTNKPWEVYVLNDSDSVAAFDKTQPHGLWGRGTLHGMFGKNQQLLSGSYELGVDVYTTDVDGDGLAEVLVPMSQNTTLHQPGDTILDDDGAILWRKWKQMVNVTNIHGWMNSACMIPVNPDHDNHIDVLTFSHGFEIDYSYWNGVELVDHPGWPKNFFPYLPTPPVMGDVDGDGQQEIIVGTFDPSVSPSSGNLHVFALDGTEKMRIAVPGGIKHIPSLADVNNDGSLDVIYRSTLGMVYVQNFGATNATNVSWATHRGNAQHDGNYQMPLFPAGTPLVTNKAGGYRKAMFSWSPATNTISAYRIYRAAQPSGPFTNFITLPPTTFTYTDGALTEGSQYIYEVAALQGTNEIHSAPFAVSALLNSNLIVNGAFEENDNSHWDKWFTGDIDWSNMIGSTNVFYQGRQAMQIRLMTNGNDGTISQFNQYGIPDSVSFTTPGTLYSFGGFLSSGGLSQPSEQWFEWTSLPTALNTNARPSLPYPNYFTPHFVVGTSPTGWVYANRTLILPTGFPNLELWQRYSVTTPTSGSIFIDNVFLRPLPNPTNAAWMELVPFGAQWRYFSAPPPSNWYQPTFDDSLWLQGQAKFGAGGGPQNVKTPLVPLLPSYYFRKTFTVTNTALEEFLLSATCTMNQDGGQSLQIYLNGQLVPATDIGAVSDQGNTVLYFDLTPFISMLKPGTNLIAAKLNNTLSLPYDDIAFDLDLKVMSATTVPVPPRIISAKPDATGVTLTIQSSSNSMWTVQSKDNLASPQLWQLVQSFTTGSATNFTIRDTGQNGRTPPQSVPARYYRLVPF